LSVEGASSRQAVLFDGSAGKVALVFRAMQATACSEQDRKRQRSNHTASLAVENAAARQHRPVRCSALPFEVVLCVICPKLDRVVKRVSTRGSDDRKVIQHRMAALNLLQRSPR
jgi:guanylate kinase